MHHSLLASIVSLFLAEKHLAVPWREHWDFYHHDENNFPATYMFEIFNENSQIITKISDSMI